MRDVLLLILGWLLGTLSPGISESLARRSRRRELIKALAVELHELRYKLALILAQVRSKLGTVDQAMLDFTKPILFAYVGDAEDAAMLDATKRLLAKCDSSYIALLNSQSGSKAS